MSETVPVNLLKALLHPYGAKLFRKRKEPTVIYRGFYGAPYYPEKKPDGSSSIVRVTDYAALNPNAMQDYEYLCFYGPIYRQSSFSNCRTCGQFLWGSNERKKHHIEKPACREKLFAALKLLRKDKKCFVCSKPFVFAKYGAFFCDDADCLIAWMHEEDNGEARKYLEEALRLVDFKKEVIY